MTWLSSKACYVCIQPSLYNQSNGLSFCISHRREIHKYKTYKYRTHTANILHRRDRNKTGYK